VLPRQNRAASGGFETRTNHCVTGLLCVLAKNRRAGSFTKARIVRFASTLFRPAPRNLAEPNFSTSKSRIT
jgi:hypothetical protein